MTEPIGGRAAGMSQWIDRPGPDDDPVVRVEDDLGDAGDVEERRPGGVADVHGDVKRDLHLQGGDTDVDDDVAQGLTGGGGTGDDAEPHQRAGGEPAKKHGDPLLHPDEDSPGAGGSRQGRTDAP